ncbi:hypothetical protein P3T18_003105 [Paraburkholderia sp. GAS199]|uniref:hypothetical protein n=1 Tax=Paraburkholderia sp. GAS199 TaxID=3035126 RepID=UPI003D24910F
MLSLKKEIVPGTWRYIGQRLQGLGQDAVPIAGQSLEHIYNYIGGTCFRIGRVSVENAFAIEQGLLRLVYVRPEYRGYRRTAESVFGASPWKIDYDHSLGRNLAKQLGYGYVLLIRIHPAVNRSHGRFERNALRRDVVPELCFPDHRILDKWLGRRPGSRRAPIPIYEPKKTNPNGLTLKQRGIWGFALGVEDETRQLHHLIPYCLPIR